MRFFLSLEREAKTMYVLIRPGDFYDYFLVFVFGRFGKTGTLSIEEMNSNQKPSPKSGTSLGTASILDVNKSTLMFIGGLGGQIKVKF